MSIADGPWRLPACTFRCGCVCARAYVCAYVCAYMCVRICVCVYVCAYVCVSMCACVRVCVRVNVLAILRGVFATGAPVSVESVSVWVECVLML